MTFDGKPPKMGILCGGRLSINHWSKKKEAAKLYLDFMRSLECHINQLVVEQNSVLCLDAYEAKRTTENLPMEMVEIRKQLAKIAFVEEPLGSLAIQKIVGSWIQKAVAGQISPQEALDKAQKEIESL
jgi:ABC-type glycerol-3-phosphate transport system substrate-binding protein